MVWSIINKLSFMRSILLLSLCFLVGCATKYIVPGNRFITPETQGGAFRGQVEFQQTGATQLSANLRNASIDDGVVYSEISRSGFLFSNSLFDRFDLVWSHTGSANSMLGGKVQIIGAPRTGNAAGHKLSAGFLFGGNEHETDDESVEFELSGREFLVMYGYRINENILPYSSFSYASYDFSGKVSSNDSSIDGLEPEYVTDVKSLSGGLEFTLDAFFLKLEATYQQLATDDTKDKERFMFGYSLGISW